eukprot:CAMPEP_0171918506 /NCGR_PEP_ID=MMETSP0993-20121228/17249_1 /TAXON_ID=483369 /ORGANISM="non described non described, Strain CCMP2098" /LENGTH=133 /DNA_ID=CAMNT_0012554875 /DNA_START=196 /DNA_END=598 /DNA_ORIENTATION=-
MMGAAGRQQRVLRCLGNQICDNPPDQHRLLYLDLPTLLQVWKPAPVTLKQGPLNNPSISFFAVLAPLAGPGNIEKTMMGAAERQQHVLLCLGNKICDNPTRQSPDAPPATSLPAVKAHLGRILSFVDEQKAMS